MACLRRQKHQTAYAGRERTGLIEPEVALRANLTERKVKAAAIGYLLLILHTIPEAGLTVHIGREAVDILRTDIHFVEKDLMQTLQC